MKKFYVTAMALVISVSMFAQKAKFGPIVGLNLSNISTNAADLSPKMNTGYHIGAIMEGAFGSSKFGAQVCLLYAVKGFKADVVEDGVPIKLTTTLNYIELPFDFTYSIGTDKFKVMPMIGFYSAYGISGKYKWEATAGGINVSGTENLKLGSSEDSDYNSIDCGLNFGLSTEIGGLQISSKYSMGVFRLEPMAVDTKDRSTNRVISISVAYLFGGK